MDRTRPIMGDSRMAEAVLITPGQTMPSSPARATPAPTNPPISAWLEDDGVPRHHVTTFQNMAPTSAPKITCGSTMSLSMIPLPMVSATFRPKMK